MTYIIKVSFKVNINNFCFTAYNCFFYPIYSFMGFITSPLPSGYWL